MSTKYSYTKPYKIEHTFIDRNDDLRKKMVVCLKMSQSGDG